MLNHTQTALTLSLGLTAILIMSVSIRVFAQPYQENSILSSEQKLISQEREAQAVVPENSIIENEQQLISQEEKQFQQLISSQQLISQEREEQAILMIPTFDR
jgi:hypothetical protein